MNKKLLVVVLIIFGLIVGGGVYFLGVSSENKEDVKPAATVNFESTQPAINSVPDSTSVPGPAPATRGTYVDYQEDIIAKTKGTKLLFFHAPWCPQCRMLDADIKQKGVPEGVAIIKVDYDTSQKLRQKYGVTLQTTIVRVDDNGELVKKYVAYDEPSLSAVAKNLL
jgi:thiol-disulfide isomerase/thioredoxin